MVAAMAVCNSSRSSSSTADSDQHVTGLVGVQRAINAGRLWWHHLSGIRLNTGKNLHYQLANIPHL
jgi:hypothetical protein